MTHDEMRYDLAKAAMAGIIGVKLPRDKDGRVSILFWGDGIEWNHDDIPKSIAARSLEMADAMLAALAPSVAAMSITAMTVAVARPCTLCGNPGVVIRGAAALCAGCESKNR